MLKRLFRLCLIFVCLGLTSTCAYQPHGPDTYNVATGFHGGGLHPIAVGLVRVWNRGLNTQAFRELANDGGSAENLELIRKGKAKLALAHAEVLRQNVDPQIRVVAPLFTSHLHLFISENLVPTGSATLRSLTITNPPNRAKWRIFVGPDHDEADLIGAMLLRYGAGLASKVQFVTGRWNDAAADLDRGSCDGIMYVSAIPTLPKTKIVHLRLLAIDSDLVKELVHHSDLQDATIQAGYYHNQVPIATVSAQTYLVADSEFSPKLTRDIVLQMYRDLGDLYNIRDEGKQDQHPIAETIRPTDLLVLDAAPEKWPGKSHAGTALAVTVIRNQALKLACGPLSGDYYQFCQELRHILEPKGLVTLAMPTGGAVDNIKLVSSGLADLGIAQADTVATQVDQNASYTNIRRAATLYKEAMHVFAKISITSFQDFRGRRIALGPVGSGTRRIALRLLGENGITSTDFFQRDYSLGKIFQALQASDDSIDGGFAMTSIPAKNIADILSYPVGVHLIDVTLPPTSSFRRSKTFGMITIPKGVYPNQSAAVQTIATNALLIARQQSPSSMRVREAISTLMADWRRLEKLGVPGLNEQLGPGQYPELDETRFEVERRSYAQSGFGNKATWGGAVTVALGLGGFAAYRLRKRWSRDGLACQATNIIVQQGGQASYSSTIVRKEKGSMGDIITKIGSGNSFGGDFTIAHKIENSLNQVAELKNDDLKTAITALVEHVYQLCAQLPSDKAADAIQYLEQLVLEAKREKPRPKWYELSAEGLIDAAKAVGGIGQQVVAAVGEVLKLLR